MMHGAYNIKLIYKYIQLYLFISLFGPILKEYV